MADLHKILQLLLFFTFVLASIALEFENCFDAKNTHNCHLGSMTPYRLIANKNDSQLQYTGCVPKKIWMLIRHGTRYPGKKWTEQMLTKLPNIWESILSSHAHGEGSLPVDKVELLKKWKFSFSRENIMILTNEGEKELIGIAERFQSRFPTIMPETYSNRTYMFKYTAAQRTEQSAKHFALGLFGRKQSLNVWYPQPEYRDPILRFYKLCKRWRETVDNNPESYRENDKFIKTPIVDELLSEVSNRAGFEVDYDSVHLIYKICAFETAWNESFNSPWCSLLSLKNFKVLEFAQDLQYYWIDGYGYPLTYQQACRPMGDVFDFFDSQDEVTTRAYFTHSGAVLKLLALLGIAKDKYVLRHDSFIGDDNRAWRTSLIDSFASNIAFVLYECENQGPSILLMHQERVVQLPDCPLNMPCPLSTIRKKIPGNESECRFNEMCANEE